VTMSASAKRDLALGAPLEIYADVEEPARAVGAQRRCCDHFSNQPIVSATMPGATCNVERVGGELRDRGDRSGATRRLKVRANATCLGPDVASAMSALQRRQTSPTIGQHCGVGAGRAGWERTRTCGDGSRVGTVYEVPFTLQFRAAPWRRAIGR